MFILFNVQRCETTKILKIHSLYIFEIDTTHDLNNQRQLIKFDN